MTRTVNFDDVKRRIVEFGDRTTIITVNADGKPHVVTAIIEIKRDRLLTQVGARTHTNLVERPALTLTWIPPIGDEYQLILDGHADGVGEPDSQGVSEITIAIDSGILHRLAGLPAPGPSCIAL